MYDVARIRREFPALAVKDDGRPRIFLDNPGGTQIARRAIERMTDYLTAMNANAGGHFITSRDSDRLLDEAHAAMADFLGTTDPAEIIFGQNMTTLTFHVSRSIGRMLSPGEEIVVTRMDHDANVSPWLMLAEDHGAAVRWLDFDPATSRYRLDALDDILSERTRLVAVNYASNAIGTINDVRSIASAAREVGALTYVDAVQFAPHVLTDVSALGADFLACSSYKFYGPHQGILWGRRDLLESLTPYKVRPASDELPGRFETGTLSHEGLAGVLGTVEHWAWIGETMGGAPGRDTGIPASGGRRERIKAAFDVVVEYEQSLCRKLINGLTQIDGVRIHGLTDPSDDADRVPTVAVTMDGRSPDVLCRALADANIFTWDGHYYAVEVVNRLGLMDAGGMLRIGLGQYNNADEVDALLNVLEDESNRR